MLRMPSWPLRNLHCDVNAFVSPVTVRSGQIKQVWADAKLTNDNYSLVLIKKNHQLHSRPQYWNDNEAAPGNGGFVNKANSLMVYSVPTGQVVPTSGLVVDSTCECSGVSTTDFYQLTGSVQLKLSNDSSIIDKT